MSQSVFTKYWYLTANKPKTGNLLEFECSLTGNFPVILAKGIQGYENDVYE
jgi:hypothetical protein